ncbi:hypothetical protein PRIPAC_88895 [Pristionchus pacificus]|uniref:Uncharacterized protein n=1 Tax=Pristionchus pacificus TaxID=54126 RepID=A0A2A6B7F9_PRIPA|nr:hypothetical protein PRIPAC_88895 [Pristionchus pacificus]|eukprot:PDM61801.1 hypothetical protein PRIPAC_51243 [Pristionchus pacificus]
MNNTTKYKLVLMIALNKDEATLDQMQNELLSILKAPSLSSLEKRMLYEDLLKRVHNFKLGADNKFAQQQQQQQQQQVEDEIGEEEQQQHQQVQRRRRSPSPQMDDYDQDRDGSPQPQQIAHHVPPAQRVVPHKNVPRIKQGKVSKRARPQAKQQKRAPGRQDVHVHHQQQLLQGQPAIPAYLPLQPPAQPAALPIAFVPAPLQPVPVQAPIPLQQAPRARPPKRRGTDDVLNIRFGPSRARSPPNRTPTYPQPPASRKRALNAPMGPPPRQLPFVRNLTTRKRATPRDVLPRIFGQPHSKRPQLGGGRLRVQSWL